ncbi:M23 family metallopeptidase [Bauldia litoralis]|uniref:M23 family metallopeptidase n=2 Tax=Bauldia litoralis TaxID=665467 RepID=UPI0032643CB8
MGRHRRVTALVVLAAPLTLSPAAAIELAFPVACEIGATCAIQHYVDRDAGPEALDYRCGHQTYDGHDGVDIRVPTLRDMTAGVAVLAAADGTVQRTRDGVSDAMFDEENAGAVADRECGNGVFVSHAGGWSTQYCHMKRGSIRVAPGDAVKAGTPLGEIGLSGMTEFPHLHFTVRDRDGTVDPFATEPAAGGAACTAAGDAATGLWSGDVAAALAYRPAYVLNAGFADAAITMEDVESGDLDGVALPPDAPALVFFGRAIGLEQGDVQAIRVIGPDGDVFAENTIDPLDRSKAQFFAFAGKRLTAAAWPAGAYRGRYSVIRDGEEIAFGEATLEMPDAH